MGYRSLDEFENMRGIKYQCVKCGITFNGDEVADRNNLRCPDCGYRVLKKVKPPMVKRQKAT